MSITDDLVFPTPTQPRELVEGDLIWVDNGINYRGYQSDYGNTWIVGREPNAREREHYAAWRAVLDRVRRRAPCGGDQRRPHRGGGRGVRPSPVALALLSRTRHRHRERGDAVRRHRSRGGVRRCLRPRVGHGDGVRADHVGGRCRRVPRRDDRRRSPTTDTKCSVTSTRRPGTDDARPSRSPHRTRWPNPTPTCSMLGRPDNARWVTGAESLWVSGTRPFAPGCVVVREPASVHLLSITDEGVPPDVTPRATCSRSAGTP